MSLQSGIEQAFLNSMYGESVDTEKMADEDKGNVPILAEELSIALTDWLKRQTFRIKDMKAYVEIEQIKTTGDIQADVKESTILGQYAPIIDFLEKLGNNFKKVGQGPLQPLGAIGDQILKPIKTMKKVAKSISKDGATVPALDMKKDGGQGGAMIATGYAYIGALADGKPDADTIEEENDYAIVQMVDGEEVA